MEENYGPAVPSNSSTRSGCVRAVGVSCLVILVVTVLIGLWLYLILARNPAFEGVFGRTRLAAECQINLEQIAGGLERYSRRNGKYPESLDDLYPDFLEKRDVLHCPADKSPKDTVSYEYKRPAKAAPGDTVVIRCERHTIVEGEPPLILLLRKDGSVVREGLGVFPGRRR